MRQLLQTVGRQTNGTLDTRPAKILQERPLDSCLPPDEDLRKYVFPIIERAPASLLRLAEENEIEKLKKQLCNYIRKHQVQTTIERFEAKFIARTLDPRTLALLLKTIRHYHNGLRGGLLYLAGRITEDTRLHRGKRDRMGAAAPLFAAFDEFTDNPNYIISIAMPLLSTVFETTGVDISLTEAVRILRERRALRRDEPHLERFYGVVDELWRAGTVASTSEEMDHENPLDALPEKAVNAYQARKILTTRPDLSYAAVAAFMFGNETIAGLLYGKLYKGFKQFQREYGLTDHACDYFGDHASEDGEADGPAFEESHANLMLNAVLMYAELGQNYRLQIVQGLHLFLETYNTLVEGLCEMIDEGEKLEKQTGQNWEALP
jgi:hypothetical protein